MNKKELISFIKENIKENQESVDECLENGHEGSEDIFQGWVEALECVLPLVEKLK